MKAITREEKIMSGENLTPITRKEMFLAKASGQNIQTPTPITREEYFLSKITGGGTGGGGTSNKPTAYTVSSVDELPTNAVDGSMAIVESDSIVGEWELNETLTSINKPFEEGFEIINSGGFLGYYYFEELEIPYIRPDYFNHFTFVGDATHLEELLFVLIDKGETISEISVYNSDEGYTSQMASRKIQILKDTDDDVFKQWLPENATRISGGYSLYTHENGRWVYKCEVV